MGRKIPKIEFDMPDVEIVLLSDGHWGQIACAKKRFIKTLNFILRRKKAFVVLGGDLVEMVTRSQKGSMLLEQDITPTNQILEMKALLEPLAKKGKILGILRDNHLQRLERDALVDMNELFANSLGIPYWGVGGVVDLVVCGRSIKLVYQHGAEAAKNEFLATDRLMRVYPGCDVYALAHNHKLSARKVVSIGMDEKGEECGKEHWQVRTGSYLKYANYAREKLMDPAVIGSPILVLSKKRGVVTVDINTLSWGGE